MTPRRDDLAATFHALHGPGRMLVLPNAWDAASARLFQDCGAEAIATTSSGIAWCHGRPDGQGISFEEVVGAVARIARAVRIPVSADVEAGYSTDPGEVGRNVAAVIDAGAVGINLEDGYETPDATARKIEAARGAGERAGVPVYVNARTDTYLRDLVPEERALEETLARARRYREAGASGLFVPRLRDPAAIGEVVLGAAMPLNLLMVPGLASVQELSALGVRRVSVGGQLARTAYAAARAAAGRVLEVGRFEAAFDAASPLDLNRILAEA